MAERWLAEQESRGRPRTLGHDVSPSRRPPTRRPPSTIDAGSGRTVWPCSRSWSRTRRTSPGSHPWSTTTWPSSPPELGQNEKAAEYRELARKQSPDYVFPFQSEAIEVLRDAMKANPNDARGTLLSGQSPLRQAARRGREALGDVGRARSLAGDGPSQPGHRPVSSAARERPRRRRSRRWRRPSRCPDRSPLHFSELDELYRAAGKAPAERLAMLETHQEIVAQRAEALSREIALLVFVGRYDDAIRLMTGRRFEVWEGGSLSVAADWTNAHILRGHRHRAAGRFPEALADFAAAGQVPDNLPSDEGSGDHEGRDRLRQGSDRRGAGRRGQNARQAWQVAATVEPVSTRRGRRTSVSDRGDQRYYQALALRKLGQTAEAESILRGLDGERPQRGLRLCQDRPLGLRRNAAGTAGTSGTSSLRGRSRLPRARRTGQGPRGAWSEPRCETRSPGSQDGPGIAESATLNRITTCPARGVVAHRAVLSFCAFLEVQSMAAIRLADFQKGGHAVQEVKGLRENEQRRKNPLC